MMAACSWRSPFLGTCTEPNGHYGQHVYPMRDFLAEEPSAVEDLPPRVEDIAAGLVRDGDRQQMYGHPRDDYERTAALWSAILGVEVTPERAVLCMVAVKLSRLCHTPDHRDSLIDLIGYGICYDRLSE